MTPGVDPFTQRTPRVSAARRLQRRRDRDETGRFLAEGPQAVREALARPGTVIELFITAEAAEKHPDIVAAAAGKADGIGPGVPGKSRGIGPGVTGESDTGGSDTGGSDTGGSDTGGSDTSGAHISDKSEISLITNDGLTSLAETVTPQGMVAVCRHLDVTLSHALTARPRL